LNHPKPLPLSGGPAPIPGPFIPSSKVDFPNPGRGGTDFKPIRFAFGLAPPARADIS